MIDMIEAINIDANTIPIGDVSFTVTVYKTIKTNIRII
jgi:hypothetical protein